MSIAALALAAAALNPAAGVRPLAPAGQAYVIGNAVDVANEVDGHFTVTQIPLAPGAATTLLDHTVPAGRTGFLQFSATPQRAVALLDTSTTGKGRHERATAYIGGTGRLEPLADNDVYSLDVSGDTAFLTLSRGTDTDEFTVAPDGTRTPITFPPDAAVTDFGGDFLGFSQEPDADQPVPHLRLYNWRTQTIVRRLDVDNGVANLDTREDGAMVLDSDGEGIKTVLPGQAPKVIYPGGGTPTWAGDRVVLLRHRKGGYRDMVMIEPNGSHHGFGVASPTLRQVSADGDDVAWSANGCAMTEPVTGGPITSLDPGPCAHSEAMITNETRRYRGTPTVEIPVRCLYADGACRGELRLRGTLPAQYTVPAGRRQYVALDVKPAVRARWSSDKDGYIDTRGRLTVQGGHTTSSDVVFVTRKHPGNPHHD